MIDKSSSGIQATDVSPEPGLSWTDFGMDGGALRIRLTCPIEDAEECCASLVAGVLHQLPWAETPVRTELLLGHARFKRAPADKGTDVIMPWSVEELGVARQVDLQRTADGACVQADCDFSRRMGNLWPYDAATFFAGFAHRATRVHDVKTQFQSASAMLAAGHLPDDAQDLLATILVYKGMEMLSASQGSSAALDAAASTLRMRLLGREGRDGQLRSTIQLQMQMAVWTHALCKGDLSAAHGILSDCLIGPDRMDDPMTGLEYLLRARLALASLEALAQKLSGLEAMLLGGSASFRQVMATADPLRLEPYLGLRKALECTQVMGQLMRANRDGKDLLPAVRSALRVALNMRGRARDDILVSLGVPAEPVP